jgi:hypothetical protein
MDKLEAAFAAYREALKELTRERIPLEWAETQRNIALVYQALFDKDHQPRHLDDALEAPALRRSEKGLPSAPPARLNRSAFPHAEESPWETTPSLPRKQSK